MYSAAMAPRAADAVGAAGSARSSFLLTDQVFAASIRKFDSHGDPRGAALHFLGGGMALWGSWQIDNVVGYFAGNVIPAAWSLEFTVPLCFIALLAPGAARRVADRCGDDGRRRRARARRLADATQPGRRGHPRHRRRHRGRTPEGAMEGALKLWVVIVAVGAINYASRLSFIAFFARRTMPPLLARALRYVPPAMLMALIVPMVVAPAGRNRSDQPEDPGGDRRRRRRVVDAQHAEDDVRRHGGAVAAAVLVPHAVAANIG